MYVAVDIGGKEVRKAALDLIAWIRKESSRPLDKLSAGAGVLCVGGTLFLKRWGLPILLYGFIFHGLPWIVARAIAFAAILVCAVMLAMRPLWDGEHSRLPPVLTLFVALLLIARALVAGLLVGLGLVFYFVVGLVIKLLGAAGG